MPARESVKRERLAKPCATVRQIATKVGISRQRAYKILASEHLPIQRRKPQYICNNCGKTFATEGGIPRLFCSIDCRTKYHLATVECDSCKKLFKIIYGELVGRIKKGREHLFCSEACRSRFIGQNFGFKAHPENIPLGRYPKGRSNGRNKWAQHIPRIRELILQGYKLSRVVEEVGIPKTTLNWLRKNGRIGI